MRRTGSGPSYRIVSVIAGLGAALIAYTATSALMSRHRPAMIGCGDADAHPLQRRQTMTILLIALGAAGGGPGPLRHRRAIQSRHGTEFPWGTFTVNVGGSFILGVLACFYAAANIVAGVAAALAPPLPVWPSEPPLPDVIVPGAGRATQHT